MNPDPIPRPRRQVPVAELFPGLSGRKEEGPTHIGVFESDDEQDVRAGQFLRLPSRSFA